MVDDKPIQAKSPRIEGRKKVIDGRSVIFPSDKVEKRLEEERARIAERLLRYIVHPNVYGSVRERNMVQSLLKVAMHLRSGGRVVKFDINKYFFNIDLLKLRKIEKKAGIPDSFFVKKFVVNGKRVETRGIPQGMATSPIRAALYSSHILFRLEKKGFDTDCYVDDFIGLLKEDQSFSQFIGAAEECLRKVSYCKPGSQKPSLKFSEKAHKKPRLYQPNEQVPYLGLVISESAIVPQSKSFACYYAWVLTEAYKLLTRNGLPGFTREIQDALKNEIENLLVPQQKTTASNIEAVQMAANSDLVDSIPIDWNGTQTFREGLLQEDTNSETVVVPLKVGVSCEIQVSAFQVANQEVKHRVPSMSDKSLGQMGRHVDRLANPKEGKSSNSRSLSVKSRGSRYYLVGLDPALLEGTATAFLREAMMTERGDGSEGDGFGSFPISTFSKTQMTTRLGILRTLNEDWSELSKLYQKYQNHGESADLRLEGFRDSGSFPVAFLKEQVKRKSLFFFILEEIHLRLVSFGPCNSLTGTFSSDSKLPKQEWKKFLVPLLMNELKYINKIDVALDGIVDFRSIGIENEKIKQILRAYLYRRYFILLFGISKKMLPPPVLMSIGTCVWLYMEQECSQIIEKVRALHSNQISMLEFDVWIRNLQKKMRMLPHAGGNA